MNELKIDKSMNVYNSNTAVLFLIFNRMDTTKRVFEAIRQAKPPRLYVACDGARKHNVNEANEVEAIRQYVLNHIDWNCEVKTLFRDENLGCKVAVNSAIDWFFEHEEQGIILEDDCLPSQSFFWFCEKLLNFYKNDLRVFLISGFNKQNTWNKYEASYFFSNLGGIWGWASWRDRWKYQDLKMPDLENFIKGRNFEKILGKKAGKKRRNEVLLAKSFNSQAWDYQWAYARIKNNGLACVPCSSLIKNIGFGPNATHTFYEPNVEVNLHDLKHPIIYNNFFVPDKVYDDKFILEKPRLMFRITRKIRRIICFDYKK